MINDNIQTGVVLVQHTSVEPLLPTPTTVIGLQSKPRMTSRSESTTLMPLRMPLASVELAL